MQSAGSSSVDVDAPADAVFARRFIALTGRPLTYLSLWRMTIAARLLRESDAPLSAVAKQIGYAWEFAFANAFKREYGIAPGRYRRQRPPVPALGILTGDVASAASKLKDDHDGHIVVYGSAQLAHTLNEHDLVDEMRLMIFPVVLGAGERLFAGTSDAKAMRLARIQAVGDTLALLSYERAGSTGR